MKLYKKVLCLGLALLIIAGIVVVLFKGFNVDLIYSSHTEIIYNMITDYELEDVTKIAKEVFKDKPVQVYDYELFHDGVQINVESITDEEKSTLVEKLNAVYRTTEIETAVTADTLTVNNIPNVRLRDWVTPYILPVVVLYAIIAVYVLIRYRKLGAFKSLGKLFLNVVLLALALLSVAAITRLPLKPFYITVLVSATMLLTSIQLLKYEKQLSERTEDKKKK